MALKFYKLYKIDRANETASAETFENLENIENYVSQVIEKHRSKYEREYKFRDGEETAKNNVMRILKDESLEDACQTMANRLLDKERVAMIVSSTWDMKFLQVCLLSLKMMLQKMRRNCFS